jgi:hypothetical protein
MFCDICRTLSRPSYENEFGNCRAKTVVLLQALNWRFWRILRAAVGRVPGRLLLEQHSISSSAAVAAIVRQVKDFA